MKEVWIVERKRKCGDGPEALVKHIRDRILSGEWGPGSRLPTRRMFQARFGFANLVNAAFQTLIDEGFLCVPDSRQQGTIVHPEPPFLTRYAVLVQGTPDDMDLHARAVCKAVEILRKEGRRIEIHFDLNRDFDDPEHLNLYRKIERHGYAGIFLEHPCPPSQRSNLLVQREVPVCGAVPQEISGSNLAPIRHPGDWFRQLEILPVLRFLSENGVKKLASLTTCAQYMPERERFFRKSATEYGISVPEGAYLVPGDTCYSLCVPALRTLLNAGPERIPDALYVANDNSLPYVIEVLREYAVRPEIQKMKVIAVGNYPFLIDFEYPVYYFAYDHLKNLRDGLAYIDAFRRGERKGGTLPSEFREYGTESLISLRHVKNILLKENFRIQHI